MNWKDRQHFINLVGAEHYKRKTSPESEASVTEKYYNKDNTPPVEDVKKKNMEKQFIELVIGFLEDRKRKYEEKGMIPTIELLIEDLKAAIL